MKTALRTSIALLGLTTLAFTARAARENDGLDAALAGSGEYQQSVAATSAKLRGYTFEQRTAFTVYVKSLGVQSDIATSELNANYIEMQASPSRRAAMNQLNKAQADFKDKVAALDNVAIETWQNTKSNIIMSWENLQGALQQARTVKS